MNNRLEERSIRLTEEEALGLLEIAMSCPIDLSPEQRVAIVKLGEFCRQFMRVDSANTLLTDSAADKLEIIMPTACAA